MSVRRGLPLLSALVAALTTGLAAALLTAPARAVVLPEIDSWVVSGWPTSTVVGDDGATVAVIEDPPAVAVLTPGAPERVIPLPGVSPAFGLAVTPDRSVAFVTRLPTEMLPEGRIERVDLITGAVTTFGDYGPYPTSLALTADGATLLVTLASLRRLAIIDAATGSLRGGVTLPTGATAVAVRGSTAYVSGGVNVSAIDIPSATLLGTVNLRTRFPNYAAESVAVGGAGVFAGLLPYADGQDPIVVSVDPIKGRIRDAIALSNIRSESISRLSIATGNTRVYAAWALGFTVGQRTVGVMALPFTEGRFGATEPVEPVDEIGMSLAVSPDGGVLAVGALRLNGAYTVSLLQTGDAPPVSLEPRGRIAGNVLRVSGTTTGLAVGTKITVHVRVNASFVAQRPKARVRADGTFTWRQPYRASSARLYVSAAGVRSATIVAR